MGRYNTDDSGVPYTCPKIDEVIAAVKSIEWTPDLWHDEKSLVNILEEIRTANNDLREHANRKNGVIHDLESEIEELNSSNMDLQNQVDDLEAKLAEMEIEKDY